MIKPTAKSNLRNAFLGIPKQTAACFEPECIQKIHWGLLQIVFEDMAAFATAHVSRSRNFIQ